MYCGHESRTLVKMLAALVVFFHVFFLLWLRFFNVCSMFFPWFFHGFSMFVLWFFHVFSMFFLWFVYGFLPAFAFLGIFWPFLLFLYWLGKSQAKPSQSTGNELPGFSRRRRKRITAGMVRSYVCRRRSILAGVLTACGSKKIL